MNPEDLKNIWAKQPASSGGVVRLTSESIWRLANESARFKRTIFWRDLREWLATILLAGGFLYIAFIPERIHWPMVVAAIIACIPMTYVASRRKKRPTRPAASLADHLRDSIARVQEQIELLRSVAAWYLAPLAVSGLIFLLDSLLTAPIPPTERKLMLFPFVLGVIVTAVVFYLVWKLNQHAARKHLEPRLRELGQTLAEVEKD
jgi:hypothetical protein